MKSLVSVIIPCFNGEEFLNRSIGSIYAQEYPNIELIVVDDGSSDRSKETILKWQKQHEPMHVVLKYVFQENRGPGGAIDTGLKYVTGEFLTLLDADDRLLPGSISERAKYLIDHPDCSIVRSNGYIVSGKNKWLFTYDESEKTGNLFEMLMRGKTFNWAGSYMVRSNTLFSFYQDRSIYPSRYGQNLQIMLPVSYRHESGFIDKPLMEYIQMSDSFTKATDKSVAKEKSISNALGYYDIRKHMIDVLPLSNKEREHWLNVAEGIYHRGLLQIAIEYDDAKMAKVAFHNLHKLGELRYSDRIPYYSYNKRNITSFFWKCIAKFDAIIQERYKKARTKRKGISMGR